MKSTRGIYYNLKETEYVFTYDHLTFYFSSNFYKQKFENIYVEYLKEQTIQLSSKYNCILYCDEMLLLNLYKIIEKRGFRVEYNGKELNEKYFINATLGSD